MVSIEYNSEVTANDLNDIAVDLGAVTFSTFQNAVPYAVSQLNDITAALVTKGILLSDSGNMCEAIAQNNNVYIQPGTIVFASGAKMKIAEAVAVEKINNTYIYAILNTTTNTSQIIVSENQPNAGDYVMLAKVNDVGEIMDMRTFSKAHVPLPTEIMSVAVPVNVTAEMIQNNPQIVVNMAGSDKLFIVRNTGYHRTDVFAVFDKESMTFDGYQATDTDSSISHIVHDSNNIVTFNKNSSTGMGDVKLSFYEISDDNIAFNITLEGRDSAYPHLFEHSFVIYVLGGVVDEK